jgi:hypothetical protein
VRLGNSVGNELPHDLNDLIQAGRPEGLAIEYKRDPYGNSGAEKKEALKDITSFANSAGGHLIIGMEEANGVATELTGLPDVGLDAMTTRLEALVRDGVEPRIVGVRMRAVRLARGGAALVIRIPRSCNLPHRVSAGRSNRFYVRNSGGVHEANVEELRLLFTLAADAQQRIKAFRAERIAMVVAGQGPVLLPANGRLFVHLVPLSAFGQAAQIDVEKAYEMPRIFRPMGSAGTPRFNLDGVINIRGNGKCYGYTQVFRSGIVEATKASILREGRDAQILPQKNAGYIADVLPSYLEGLRILDVPPPIVVMVSFQGVAGAKLQLEALPDPDGIQPFPPGDPLLMPEVIVNDYGPTEEYDGGLRQIFDALWNAAGFAKYF